MDRVVLDEYLAECRELTIAEIGDIIPADRRYRKILYDLVLDYPLRQAKALRPALCIATCRALGGALDSVLRSAAVLELYHNAFLIHDDIEDGSDLRRGRPTLHVTHGSPIAVNVGDAMLALALQPLLDNMRQIGMGKALRVLEVVARMARESAEGQALELHWIRNDEWRLSDADYVRMVYKKTSWYSFIAPMLVGAITAGAAPEVLVRLRKFAALLGIAFQIQDDVLNLAGESGAYGKEAAGDLWEGKHTLILLHTMRSAGATQRRRACAILAKPRPSQTGDALAATLTELLATRQITPGVHARLAAASGRGRDRPAKSNAEIEYLRGLIEGCGSLDYARRVAQRYAEKAARLLRTEILAERSVHHDFLRDLVDFVIERTH